jgi:hypothetical protein
MAVNNAAQQIKTVADPIAAFDDIMPLWARSRAVCSGERYVKSYDQTIDNVYFSNLLLPFSPSMTQRQFDFYKSEAEFPGMVSQYAKTLVGGLLRKQPTLKLPEKVPTEAHQWIMDAFAQDNAPLASFLDRALWEEVQTSRAWVYVDYPVIPNPEELSAAEYKEYKPYPLLLSATSVINWKTSVDKKGVQQLSMLVIRSYEEDTTKNEFHPEFVDIVYVHEILNGMYQIRKYRKASTNISENALEKRTISHIEHPVYNLVETKTDIMYNGERLNFIPAWPLNGSIEITEPLLTPLIDREISLYNKISRRNHLLYGASTYTPIIISDMSDEDFDKIVSSGLGTWIRLRQGDDAKVLETPTGALQDMEKAIAATVEDMAKMGIRMLSPESAQSGVALEIRNASQTAQLGTLNTKISNTMSDIIAFMLNWRYDLQLVSSDIEFSLSADFNPTPLGADWLRLVTEWYQNGLIPRSVWLMVLKQNDMIAPDYNDEDGKLEINGDEMVTGNSSSENYLDKLKDMSQ